MTHERSQRHIVPLLIAVATLALFLSPAQSSRAASSYVISPADPNVGAACASLGGELGPI